MADWSTQQYWEDVREGDLIPAVDFPVTVHRLIVHVAANRDFSGIHHNPAVAQGQGAPDMYANNVFAQGMWERTVREFIGLAGVIRRIGPLRMRFFTTPGQTVTVRGEVTRKWRDGADHFVELAMASTVGQGDCVVGRVTVTLPVRSHM